MTAPNHALTGALIGFAIGNPWLAVPAAFLSHFACDAIPHYDPPETSSVRRINSRRFIWEFLILGAVLCLVVVAVLAWAHPVHWLLAAICAFTATSPDLFWVPRFLQVKRTGKDAPLTNMFLRFHADIQWKTGPRLIWLEAAWFVGIGALVFTYL